MKKLLIFLTPFLFLNSCSPKEGDQSGSEQITSDYILSQIRMLASDDFLGRKPFTQGEERTIDYLKREYANLGLEPANGDSYFQDVPMVEIDADIKASSYVGDPFIEPQGLNSVFSKDKKTMKVIRKYNRKFSRLK